MLQKIFATCLVALLLAACSDNSSSKETRNELITPDSTMTRKSVPSYKDIAFDSKKDLVCGMPVKAGVSDTVHYKGKVYGFCAIECKDEFLKNPGSYLTTK